MEKIDNEYYVSLEVAKLLEKAGFDWRCRKCYNKGVLFDIGSDEIRAQVPQHSSYDVLAPTLEVAQRWLREDKGYIVEVLWYKKEFDYQGMVIEDEHYKWFSSYPFTFQIEGKNVYDIIRDKDGNHYSTHESALEAGIKKALEPILEK